MKTAEQEAREYADRECESSCRDRCEVRNICNIYARRIKNFLAGAEWAYRWIPVSEELPIASDEDLLLKGIDDRGVHGIVDIGYMHEPGTSANNFISLGGALVKITHWRPIEHKIR